MLGCYPVTILIIRLLLQFVPVAGANFLRAENLIAAGRTAQRYTGFAIHNARFTNTRIGGWALT